MVCQQRAVKTVGEPRSSRIAVLVVSYNTATTTLECVRRVLDYHAAGVDLVVVDNASTDRSVASLMHEFGSRIRVIANETNVGFGRANNQAWALCRAEYVLLLNSDCFVNEETVAACSEFLDDNPEAAAVACQLRNADGTVQSSCRRFPSVWSEIIAALVPYQISRWIPYIGAHHMAGWNHTGTREVDQPAGAFLMLRNGAWGDGPLFDERFFMYYEDVDLCRRVAGEGGRIYFTDIATATHLREHSSRRALAQTSVALAESRYLYFRKWFGRREARVVAFAGAIKGVVAALANITVGPFVRGVGTAYRRATAHLLGARASIRLALGRSR